MWSLIVFLIVVGMLLLISETFMPGGILGTIGFILVVIGIVITYREHGTFTGNIVLLISVVSTLLLVVIGLKIFPKTSLGKMVILHSEVSREEGFDSSVTALDGLLGMTGIVATDLRPSGIAIIDDKRINVISEGGYITMGESVKVIKVDGNKVLVVREHINSSGGIDNG